MTNGTIETTITGGQIQGVAGAGTVVIENFTIYNRAAEEPAITDVAGEPMPPCPYPGLAYFGPADADLFFGRDAAIARLAEAVGRQSLTALVGASGSGKSSVVLAGLAPHLHAARGWRFSHFRIGTDSDPFMALARALVPLYVESDSDTERLLNTRQLAEALKAGELKLGDVFADCRARNKGTRVLLIADQFEEAFTLVKDEALLPRFIDVLLAGFPDPTAGNSPDICLVLTLRADFYGRALHHRPLADALQGHIENLGPMNRRELQAAICRPAESANVSFEPGLVETLLDEVENKPGSLPLLQFALREMWGRQEQRKITRKSYDEIGGVEGALAKRAETIFAAMTENGANPQEARAFQRLFTRLVTLGEGQEDTRRVVERRELGADAWALAQRLADENNRLVVTSAATPEHETAELIHEALIRHWPTLADWINRDRAFQSWLRQLAPRVNEWRENPGDPGTLLRGGALAVAEDWLQRRREEVSDEERAYIAASVASRDATRRRQQLRQRVVAVAALCFFVVAVAAIWFWKSAVDERDRKQQALATISDTGAALTDLRKEFAMHLMPMNLLDRIIERTIGDYDAAIRLEPENAAVYTNRGAAYQANGDFDKAIDDHDEAIRLNPQYAAAYKNRASAYMGKGDYDRAIQDFDRAIQLDPTLAIAYSGRAESYYGKGDYDRAIQDYDEAIRRVQKDAREPHSVFVYLGRGGAYAARGIAYMGKGDKDRAARTSIAASRVWIGRSSWTQKMPSTTGAGATPTPIRATTTTPSRTSTGRSNSIRHLSPTTTRAAAMLTRERATTTAPSRTLIR
jgi:tetratricopeptide (TPR) repeat protein